MKNPSIRGEPSGIAFAFAAAAGAFLAGAASVASGAQGVIITGLQVNHAEETNPEGDFNSRLTIEDICDNADELAYQVNRALDAVELGMLETGWTVPMSVVESTSGMPTRADLDTDVTNLRAALCDAPKPKTTAEVFTITYGSCRMAMTTPTNAMVINVPEGGDTAYMLAADHTTREVAHIELTSHIDAASGVVGQGWSDNINMVSTGQTAEISGYDTAHYKFDYKSGLGETDQGELGEDDIHAGQINDPTRLGNLVTVESDGEAWIAANAPGVDIVKLFYQNLTSRFEPSAGADSFFSGMISSMVGILDKGIPIVIDQTTSSSVMGRMMGRSRSESYVSNIRLWEMPPEWCQREVAAPAGYTVTDVNQEMGAESAEMAAAMQEYNAAMEQMTPEQRQMMAQMGLGGMMGQTGAGMTTAQAPQATVKSTGAGPAASNKSRSAELTTGNPTQTVQQHLAALGYDTGNTSGEMSLETTIAISQFQAEKGMAVTGEVSPQLIGALAAEVDRGQ
ncbi:MAG TPA: peptidoglycan-binding domain-containing protein [Woeseiaceae bacterium]|nr:peptidoglycan-binding domain-containing protein [Woeseiaceae bacterium]